MDGRKLYEELTRRPVPDETMPSPSSGEEGHRASDVPPTDRERFTALLNEAARKREQED